MGNRPLSIVIDAAYVEKIVSQVLDAIDESAAPEVALNTYFLGSLRRSIVFWLPLITTLPSIRKMKCSQCGPSYSTPRTLDPQSTCSLPQERWITVAVLQCSRMLHDVCRRTGLFRRACFHQMFWVHRRALSTPIEF